MAFSFNWTPLIASASSPEFYSHARELLTLAFNKSTKSSGIVDSYVAAENLHLGHSAPELEVLEIGDLAEDSFRGVFRMTCDGDAQVTVKARVQVVAIITSNISIGRLTCCFYLDQPVVHVSRYLGRLHIAASISRGVLTAHALGIQVVGIRDPGVSQRSTRIHESAIVIRLDTVHKGLSAERD